MMRLHHLTPEQIEAWQEERLRVGQQKYKDAHMQRYGMVDLMEELLDAINILSLHTERCKDKGAFHSDEDALAFDDLVGELNFRLWRLVGDVQRIDKAIPDELCTDERGGNRIWWTKEAAKHGQGE